MLRYRVRSYTFLSTRRSNRRPMQEHSPCLAISSRIFPPPISNTTRPKGTLQAQYSKLPFPLPIRVSLPLTQTGTSGNTRINTSAPLTGLILRLMAVWADESWSAVSRAAPSVRIPNVPCSSVVPFSDPPYNIDDQLHITPLVRFDVAVRGSLQ